MSEPKARLAHKKTESLFTNLPLIIATILTIAFGIAVFNLGIQTVVIENISATRFSHFLAGSPNTMGDTLSGFVGSLTLIWVIASVIQQSMELRAQRNEFAEMVVAQDAQVKALNAQAEIFQAEQKQRDQSVASQTIDALLQLCLDQIRIIRDELIWKTSNHDANGTVFTDSQTLFAHFTRNVTGDDYFIMQFISIQERVPFLEDALSSGTLISKSDKRDILSSFYNLIKRIESETEKLSEAKQLRMARLKVSNIRPFIERILFSDEYWELV